MKPHFLEKRGSFIEALNLSAKWVFRFLFSNYNKSPFQTNIGYISRGGHFWWKWGYSVRAFISKNGVIQWEHLNFLKWGHSRGSLSERAFWKWGSLGESKMWKIKRGSFSDRRFENGGQWGHTYPSRILGSDPPECFTIFFLVTFFLNYQHLLNC